MSEITFLPVLLWSDVLIWLLVLAALALGFLSSRNPLLRAAWQRVGRSRPGMAAATVLLFFLIAGLLDSIHYRPQLPGREAGQPPAYAVEVLSLLDAAASPLRTRSEKTYSEPLATRAYAKEAIELREADGSVRQMRDFPRLTFGGAHLQGDEARHDADIVNRALRAEALACALWAAFAAACACPSAS